MITILMSHSGCIDVVAPNFVLCLKLKFDVWAMWLTFKVELE